MIAKDAPDVYPINGMVEMLNADNTPALYLGPYAVPCALSAAVWLAWWEWWRP